MTQDESNNDADALPPGWARTTLGELLFVLRGVSYDKLEASSEPSASRVPVLRATNIGDGLNFDDLVYVLPKCVSEEQYLRVGDMVIAASSGSASVVGKAAPLLHDWRGSFGAFCYCLRPSQQLDERFIALFLQTTEYRHKVSALAAGVNINNLRRHHIEEITFNLPPLAEQRRIVAEIETRFSVLEAGVANLRRVLANLKRYRASVLQAACEGRLVPTEAEFARQENRGYEPASVQLLRLRAERRARWEIDQLAKMTAQNRPPKDDKWKTRYEEPAAPDTANLPALPEGWIWSNVGQVAPLLAGFAFSSKEFAQVGTRLLKGNNIRDGWLFEGEIDYWASEDAARFSKFILHENDIVIAMDRPVYSSGSRATKVVRLNRNWDGALLLQRVGKFSVSPFTCGGYVYTFLCSEQFRHHLVISQNGSQDGKDLPHISNATVDAARFPLPPLAEQRRIVAEVERRLSVVERTEAVVAANLKRAERLKQAILRQAFAGRLVPQDPTDEPADALLERIRADRQRTAVSGQQGKRGAVRLRHDKAAVQPALPSL